MEQNEKKCRICGRVLIGENKFGICPRCINEKGSVLASIAAGTAVSVAFLIRNKIKKRFF
ncbi:MAG: hypothetical protein J6P72_06920 [Firmicutes bacterium]|nr:hypothetical protein [Bacillota bacterium]